jgi:hypothetical protein
VVLEKASFPRTLEVPGARLLLEGAGLFRWKYFVKVYAAAHYVGEEARGRPADADVPRRLEIAYFVGISGKDFGRAADELLSEALPPDRLEPLRSRLEDLHRAYVDVKAGDRYALTYVPGRGTELALNGAPIALIPGADFARAYFGIWIGTRPIDDGLRDALLPGRAGST